MSPKHDYELDDIFFIALKMEKNGEDFYRRLARQIKGKENRALLVRLADEEEKHAQEFLKIYDALKKGLADFTCHFLDKIPALAETADHNVFTEERMREMCGHSSGTHELLDSAIENEEASARFYEGIKAMVHEEHAFIVEKLIQEERHHKQALQDLKNNLS